MNVRLVLSLVALVACTRNLDLDKIKASIKSGIQAQLGLELEQVTCPETRVKAGTSFDCAATIGGGGQATFKVTIKDAAGHVDWAMSSMKGVLFLQQFEATAAKWLKDEMHVEGAVVTCGSRFVAREPGKTFECKAKAGAAERTIIATVKDASGAIDYRLAPLAPGAEAAAEKEGDEKP